MRPLPSLRPRSDPRRNTLRIEKLPFFNPGMFVPSSAQHLHDNRSTQTLSRYEQAASPLRRTFDQCYLKTPHCMTERLSSYILQGITRSILDSLNYADEAALQSACL